MYTSEARLLDVVETAKVYPFVFEFYATQANGEKVKIEARSPLMGRLREGEQLTYETLVELVDCLIHNGFSEASIYGMIQSVVCTRIKNSAGLGAKSADTPEKIEKVKADIWSFTPGEGRVGMSFEEKKQNYLKKAINAAFDAEMLKYDWEKFQGLAEEKKAKIEAYFMSQKGAPKEKVEKE